jgi:hypothetical protein
MRTTGFAAFIGVTAVLVFSSVSPAWGQDAAGTTGESKVQDNNVAIVVGHPFSAIKYARQVRVLPDGKQQFIRNEQYPTRIARDADGRVMMQEISSDDLRPECDHLELHIPPICPVWGIFVFDPITHTISHWLDGERAVHAAVDFPLTEGRLDQAAHATAEVPQLPPDFSDEDGEVSTVDLGEKTIEGVQVHGVRSTLQYAKTGQDGTKHLTRVHEVWTAPAMKLIVRVIDGDPSGTETVRGIEKVTLSPDPSLFRPPADYEWQHRNSDRFTAADFECIDSWFAK